MPSIDESGNHVVFDSYSTNLLEELGSSFTKPQGLTDSNNQRDVFLIDLTDNKIFLANLNYNEEQASGGDSQNARISGDGETIVFESKAQNLVSSGGIASIVVTEGGFGYQGTPTIEIFDDGFNIDGSKGRDAELILKDGGINALSEIKSDGIQIINAGTGFTQPRVRIIPDPSFPDPTFEASAEVYLSNPEGDVYYVKVEDLENDDANYSVRVSQSISGTGGNFGSRDPSISHDGESIVYSTKSSNLLPSQLVRDDGKIFYNSSFSLPSARTYLVGEIGEIEIAESGRGYSAGVLRIEDLSGTGSGAIASYDVDNRGRIVTVKIVEPGSNYRLDTTVISVEEPRGGSGFKAGQIRFTPTIGEGVDRRGGGRIHRVEMTDHGNGYFIGESQQSIFSELIQFEGDGADLNEDGFTDGRMNPDRVHVFEGGLYIEQRFSIDILSNGTDLENTILYFKDHNHTVAPITITFGATLPGSIPIEGFTLSEIRDALINQLVDQLAAQQTSDVSDVNVTSSPFIVSTPESNSFTFCALSGTVEINSPGAVKISALSNMLVMGSGYTTATPVINQVPSLYGFSETLTNPSFLFGREYGKDGFAFSS